jgi:hypothetical protein
MNTSDVAASRRATVRPVADLRSSPIEALPRLYIGK